MHQGLPVEGYRPQSDTAVNTVNLNKRKEEEILQMIDVLQDDKDTDKRWLAIAKTHIELGFMAMNRSIFKPARISIPKPTEEDDEIPF